MNSRGQVEVLCVNAAELKRAVESISRWPLVSNNSHSFNGGMYLKDLIKDFLLIEAIVAKKVVDLHAIHDLIVGVFSNLSGANEHKNNIVGQLRLQRQETQPKGGWCGCTGGVLTRFGEYWTVCCNQTCKALVKWLILNCSQIREKFWNHLVIEEEGKPYCIINSPSLEVLRKPTVVSTNNVDLSNKFITFENPSTPTNENIFETTTQPTNLETASSSEESFSSNDSDPGAPDEAASSSWRRPFGIPEKTVVLNAPPTDPILAKVLEDTDSPEEDSFSDNSDFEEAEEVAPAKVLEEVASVDVLEILEPSKETFIQESDLTRSRKIRSIVDSSDSDQDYPPEQIETVVRSPSASEEEVSSSETEIEETQPFSSLEHAKPEGEFERKEVASPSSFEEEEELVFNSFEQFDQEEQLEPEPHLVCAFEEEEEENAAAFSYLKIAEQPKEPQSSPLKRKRCEPDVCSENKRRPRKLLDWIDRTTNQNRVIVNGRDFSLLARSDSISAHLEQIGDDRWEISASFIPVSLGIPVKKSLLITCDETERDRAFLALQHQYRKALNPPHQRKKRKSKRK